jgi:D-xylose transport system substrate-binding protein
MTSSFVGLRRVSIVLVALLAIAFTIAACGDDDNGGGGDGGGPTIALLLPENQTPRYESADRLPA